MLTDRRFFSSRRGVVLFVVLGGVFVLTILVMAYNHLVQGKFNESREILKHLRAMKCAQAAARMLVCKLKEDLNAANAKDPASPGYALRNKIFVHNDPETLAAEFKKVWLANADIEGFVKKLFGEEPTKDVSVNYDVKFSDIRLLSDYKTDKELFFDCEKGGRMTLTVEVFIGNTREEWHETRPFRVVIPFPMPLTKYTLYLREATDENDPVKFNTVAIDSPATGDIAPGSNKPIIIDNGLPGDHFNKQAEIWKKRGWIYLGGGNLLLNRAAGHRKFGQRYHSYFPTAENPITLLLNFSDFNGWPVNGHQMVFRIARWGFSNAVIDGPASDMWKKILDFQFREHKPEKEKKWWNSSFLHLFGEAGNSETDRRISITRVTGRVYDRFLELSYLIPGTGAEPPVGAVVGLPQKDYDKYSGKKRNFIPGKLKDVDKIFIKDVFVDKNLIYLPAPPDAVLGVPDLTEMEDFFIKLPYSALGNLISYEKIMSKADFCSYDESYSLIAQYSKNTQSINIPPDASVLPINDMNFALPVLGTDQSKLQINTIPDSKDPALGLTPRVCYEIDAAKNQDVFAVLKSAFCSAQNSDFNLANAVVRVKTGGKGLKMGDNLGATSGGAIIVDGPVEVGTFRSADNPEKAQLMILAEKGAITVRNSGQHPTLAYLVALDKSGGEVKPASQQAPLQLFGGIAAHTLDPENFAGGGGIMYNQSFDPTVNPVEDFVGVVIGPSGGEI